MGMNERRENILKALSSAQTPVSASALAREMGVSRQVIVGDIALLRMQGSDIVSTVRGYTMPISVGTSGAFTGRIICQHSLEATEKELSAIVSAGAQVLDVTVTHDLYGEITGQLNITSLEDVEAFLHDLSRNKAKLLSELTNGVHVHSISCKDAGIFETVKSELARLNLLYDG